MSISGRVPSEPGSREPSPDGLGPSGFDPSRSELDKLRDLVWRTDAFLLRMVSELSDEGDRVYLGSTNDADDLQDFLRELEAAVYEMMEAGRE